MKVILAVDLDDGLVSSLAAGLRERRSEVRLQRVPLARAPEAVRREVFDMVVLDRGDRPASPAALVAALCETSPATRLVVVGEVDKQDRALFGSFGNVEVMGRPVQIAELVARIAAALQRGVNGHLENVGLAAFTQLLALEKETCTLNVRCAAGTGTLFFMRGELYDAEQADRTGEEAAIQILDWEIADVEMTGSCLRSRRSIQRPLTFLLIEAMRRRDERGRGDLGGESQSAGASPTSAPAAGAEEEAAAHDTLVPALAREIEGFVAAALVELFSGATLEALTTRPDLDPNLASAFCCELLRQEIAMLQALGLRSTLDEVVLTFSDQIHVVKLGRAGRFLYVVVDRARTSFPALRSTLQRHWEAFEARPAPAAERQASDRSVAAQAEWIA
jgi:DNA-binding response OmpR family regulator